MGQISENPLKAFIDLNAFNNNIKIIKKKFPNSMIILPVKANAYGHGDLIISEYAQKINIDYLAISRVSEGIKLRENNISSPIINFGVEIGSNIDHSINNNIELSVSSLNNIKEIEKRARSLNKKINLHLKVDTGMRRLGCRFDELLELAKYIYNSNTLTLKSLYSHFARSDDSAKVTDDQTGLFIKGIKLLSENGIKPGFIHIFNSGSILRSPSLNIPHAVRPGIMCYGYTPFKDTNYFGLKPVMTLRSKVLHLKEVPKGTGISYGHTFVTKKPTILATISLGYGDGFPRSLSNKFKVTINGKHYQQLGTISMDLTVIEADEGIKIGDEVIIFGNKKECINSAKELASKINTISYEITTSLTDRIERVIK